MNILPLTYLGNVQYHTKLCFSPCVIDVCEHFVKQSYRSRCDILGSNGVIPLTVPVVSTPNDRKAAVKDTRIDYSKRWQHRHWESIRSAYRQSPYFEHYEADFAPYYERRYDFLLDYNLGLTRLILQLLGSDAPIVLSEQYIPADGSGYPAAEPEKPEENAGSGRVSDVPLRIDFRQALSPKPRLHRDDHSFAPRPYWQVFSERMPFIPNLSIIDLLCCEGPNALSILQASIRTG